MDAGAVLGVLPLGTFNYFCRVHGIPDDLADATRLLLDGVPRPVQAGLVNDRLFLVSASLGLYPQVIEDREAYKRRYGRSRIVALWAGLVTLMQAHRPLRLALESHGAARQLRTPTLFVGNNALQLAQLGIAQARGHRTKASSWRSRCGPSARSPWRGCCCAGLSDSSATRTRCPASRSSGSPCGLRRRSARGS